MVMFRHIQVKQMIIYQQSVFPKSEDTMSDRRTILILSANPKGTNPLRLGEEVREIKGVTSS